MAFCVLVTPVFIPRKSTDFFVIKIATCNFATKSNNSGFSSGFINNLNFEFERLNFGYCIVNNEIVEITSEEEVKSIETALNDSNKNIQVHLNEALKLYAQRQAGDYRNSIKESISAVEVYCREKTGEVRLVNAIDKGERAANVG